MLDGSAQIASADPGSSPSRTTVAQCHRCLTVRMASAHRVGLDSTSVACLTPIDG
jgi:hypothetical protein